LSRILVATANPGKLREFEAALAAAGIEAVGLAALSDPAPVEETGATFEENARIKAEAYSQRTDLPVLADDSGLEVDALNGEPGVLSARYGGPGLSDGDRVRVVVRKLAGVPKSQRAGRFRCVLAVARAGKVLGTFEGVVEGRILDEPRGKGGFGYDPIFFHEGVGWAFGELSLEEKQALSHRGKAIRSFLDAVRSETLALE
jgi:XTP/dITP diphosphohydrolase